MSGRLIGRVWAQAGLRSRLAAIMIIAILPWAVLAVGGMACHLLPGADRGRQSLPANALGLCGVAILLSWHCANVLLVMPMRRLAAAAARAGDAAPGASALDAARDSRLAFDPPEMRRCHAVLAALAPRLAMRDELTMHQERATHHEAMHGKQIASAREIPDHNEERAHLSAAGAGSAVVRLDAASPAIDLAQASLADLGYAHHELCGGDWRRLIHPDDQKRFAAVRDSLSDARPRMSLVCRAVRKDGAIIWVESLVCRMGIGACVVTLRDITCHLVMPPAAAAAASAGGSDWQATQPVHIDAVTGLLNRRGFDAALGLEYRCAARLGTPLAMIMIEIDRLRPQGGPDVGPGADACLQVVGHAIGLQLRRSRDRIARYGAAKFAAILPATDQGHAMIVANAVRRAIEEAPLYGASRPAIMLGAVRMGVAAVLAGRDEGGPARLVELAEAALQHTPSHRCASA